MNLSTTKTHQVQDVKGIYCTIRHDVLVQSARRAILESFPGDAIELSSPKAVRDHLQVLLAGLEYEVFAVLLLNAQNRFIHYEELFRGTIDGASVYPRDVLKLVLEHNANATILVHNHPSGLAEPSQADHRITERLKTALSYIDVRTLDHIVVGSGGTVSFAERGWL